jgi:DNA mismatch repair protein MSH2
LGYSCIECLTHSLRLLDNDENFGKYELRLGSLEKYMRLDSTAAEAINLLPKSDHPSQFGSVYGVLNRCKTKMGSRLLDRWLQKKISPGFKRSTITD